MTAFEEGYAFFAKQAGVRVAGFEGDRYVSQVDEEIEKLIQELKAFDGYKTKTEMLKGDIAEYWHTGTFNIDAVARGSDSRTYVERSHEFASVDISSNFEKVFGLKYYNDGVDSAKQQAKSVFECFKQYQSSGGKDTLEAYLEKRGYTDDAVLHDPIYSGQVRVIPKGQLETACTWLKQKIAKEATIRPEQVKKYQEVLDMLTDRLYDNKGTESIPLSVEDAQYLAKLAKTGDATAKVLKQLGVSADQVIHFEYLVKQAFNAGTNAATLSLVLNLAPEIIKVINFLIESGELDAEQFKQVGFAALTGASEGFVRGSISSAITIACKSGMLGDMMIGISPAVIGMATVVTMDTMKNSFYVACGRMTRTELSQELIRELIVSASSMAAGTVVQAAIGIPVVGFMIGSFVGSAMSSFAYDYGCNAVMSFCVDTGFTMFGLVKQDYTLPEDVMEAVGIDVFRYKEFKPKKFKPEKITPTTFNAKEFKPDTIEIRLLRRGVIGVSKIGYY